MASKFLGTYNPNEVTVNFGPLSLTGFMDGTFVSIKHDDPKLYKKHVGARGEVSRTVNNNKSATITVTLKATSPSNKFLQLAKNNPALVPLMIKNNSDAKYIAVGAESWIDNDPDIEAAVEEGSVVWEFGVAELVKGHI